MGQTNSRQYNYHQYYNAIKNDKTFDFTSINFDLLDPYEVLNVNKNFSWDELKTSYRNTALITHPDKKGGNKIIFDFVTECFRKLAIEFKYREENKHHYELKKHSQDYMNENKSTYPSDYLYHDNNENFNVKFNKTFEKCKLTDDENDFGYGEIMDKSSAIRDDIKIDKIIDKKINTQSFNDIFTKHIPVNKQLTKYKEPEALSLAKSMQFSEIGGKKPDDYSSPVESANRNNLVYTDYMKAYSNTRLVDESMINNHKSFKSVEEFEKYRDTKIKKGLTDKEKRFIELKTKREEEEEFKRQERIKMKDIEIQKNHEKANRFLIK
jgi:curved DNA-binding protein CbpA